jgi:uncharacterized Zn finger protein
MRHRYGRFSRHGRSRYEAWNGFAPYVPVAERRAKAAQQAAKLAKKGQTLRPVVLTAFAIASKWWGKAWCRNLERYADFANRIGRGRSYVRHGAVLDLQIEVGLVRALVQGSQAQPYRVNIQIAPLSHAARAQVETACQGQISSLPDLLAGQFPKALESLFTDTTAGLFPAPAQITFDCSCPDEASMCKHVAAVLYGIGARLDEDPGLFFALRGLEPAKLIGGVVRQRTNELLAKAAPVSGKVLADADLAGVFGIELATPSAPTEDAAPAAPPATPPPASVTPATPPVAAKRPRTRKAPPSETPAKLGVKQGGAGILPADSVPEAHAKGRFAKASSVPPSAAPLPPAVSVPPAAAGSRKEQLLAVMRAHGKAENALYWMRAIGWTESQTRNTLSTLINGGKVSCPTRGAYLAGA